ncbi:MAG: allantoate amidohydrolase [Opitutae bacterium]|nr:allantoate amidohydrolase [Opitutae bacterium]
MAHAAQELVRKLGRLSRVTDEPGKLTRTFLSPAMKRANALVAGWMKDAGLKVRVDSVGNLIGCYEAANPKSKTLLLGSHLDTVRDAGKFDGPLGVLLPIVALADLKRRGVKLPFDVEVLGFSEEEGVRFASAYLGSKGYCGKLTAKDLAMIDADGVSVSEAIERWNGLTPGRSSKRVGVNALHLKAAHKRGDLLGYVEVHIEQGPVLEAKKLAVGVVSAIAGQSRFKLTWTGQAGHAGMTPMALRRDALAGAAEFVSGVEAIARRTPGLVATVGALTVSPGAANVIPGEVVHTLDVRHADDRRRRQALMAIGRLATQIANRRELERRWQRTQENGAVTCSPALTAQLARSMKAIQGKSVSLVSGAGHDGVVMSALCPVAMLFVRCRGGLSHHPDEYASPKDLGVALAVMTDFLERLAAEQGLTPLPAAAGPVFVPGSRRGRNRGK